MEFADLFRTPGTNRLSHTRLWANIGYATATGCVIWQTAIKQLTAELLLIYLVAVGTSAGLSKFLSLRYGVPPDRIETTETEGKSSDE